MEKRFFIAVSILIGTCIGAGVLGIPYVAAQSGFWLTLFYILFLGSIVLLVNLYFGEIVLRTKGNHQLVGYVKKYLGKNGSVFMEFATIFGIYSALIAYMLGMGESLSFIFLGNSSYSLHFGILTGIFMSLIIYGGVSNLKRFEKYGVSIILLLLLVIFFFFINKINFSNLDNFYHSNLFLPFGVVLFSLMSFHAIPQIKITLRKNYSLFKKSIILGSVISIIFYILFMFIVLGYQGNNTPEVATLSLGKIFVFLGLFTMFTSYLALGNALLENLTYDERLSYNYGWFFSSVIPIPLFIFLNKLNFVSFTEILSIGGVVSGGISSILILIMVKNARLKGDREPEYQIPINRIIILILSVIFVLGMLFSI